MGTASSGVGSRSSTSPVAISTMSFASCAVSRGHLSRLVDTSPDAGAPPSLFHRLIALAFMSASVDGVFALLLMPQLCHGCRGLSMASRRVRFQRPHYQRSEPYPLRFVDVCEPRRGHPPAVWRCAHLGCTHVLAARTVSM